MRVRILTAQTSEKNLEREANEAIEALESEGRTVIDVKYVAGRTLEGLPGFSVCIIHRELTP